MNGSFPRTAGTSTAHKNTAGTSTVDSDEPWKCRHIRLSNPAGPGHADVPRLLRAVADLLDRIGDDVEVLDLGFREEKHRDGPWTAMNIYYRRGAPRPSAD